MVSITFLNERVHCTEDRKEDSRRNPDDPILVVTPTGSTAFLRFLPYAMPVPRFVLFPVAIFSDGEGGYFDGEVGLPGITRGGSSFGTV